MINQSSENNRFASWFPWLVCGLAALFYSYEYLLRLAPNVMTFQLMQAFQIDATTFSNLVAYYYYAYTPAQLMVGVLMDRYGPRRLLSITCLICAVGAYMFAGAEHTYVIAISRFLMGLGSAFAFVGVLKLATIWLPPERFGLVAGLTSALGSVGGLFGEVLMTQLVEKISWHPTMMMLAGIGLLLSILLVIFIRDGTEEAKELDESSRVDFGRIIVSFGKILKNPQVWYCGMFGCLIYLPTTVFVELWGKTYLQAVNGYSPDQAAWAIAMVLLGFTIGGPLSGWVSDTLKRRRMPMFVGGTVATIVMAILILLPDLSRNTTYILLFLLGVFYGSEVIVFAVGREVSPRRAAGTAVAVVNMMVSLGGFVQPIVGVLLDWHWSGEIANNLHVYTAADYRFALSIIPILMATGLCFLYFLKETGCKLSKE